MKLNQISKYFVFQYEFGFQSFWEKIPFPLFIQFSLGTFNIMQFMVTSKSTVSKYDTNLRPRGAARTREERVKAERAAVNIFDREN